MLAGDIAAATKALAAVTPNSVQGSIRIPEHFVEVLALLPVVTTTCMPHWHGLSQVAVKGCPNSSASAGEVASDAGDMAMFSGSPEGLGAKAGLLLFGLLQWAGAALDLEGSGRACGCGSFGLALGGVTGACDKSLVWVAALDGATGTGGAGSAWGGGWKGCLGTHLGLAPGQ